MCVYPLVQRERGERGGEREKEEGRGRRGERRKGEGGGEREREEGRTGREEGRKEEGKVFTASFLLSIIFIVSIHVTVAIQG